MSVLLTDRILEADIPSRTIKLVLLKLAKHASPDGRRIFPSVAVIAKAAQCSSRQAQRILAELRGKRIIQCVRQGGRGPRATEYIFDLEVLDRLLRDGWDRFTESPAWSAERQVVDQRALQPAQYDPMVSYSTNESTTSATRACDTWCHPNSQEEASITEKERARTASSFFERNPLNPGHARQACAVAFETFFALWPDRAMSDASKSLKVWQALAPGERQAALAGIEPFHVAWKAAGRTYPIAAQTYLADRRWLMRPQDPEAATIEVVEPWTLSWWQVVLWRLTAGKRVSFAFTEARSGRSLTVAAGELIEAAAALPRLQQVEPDGADGEAWRAWLVERGVRLPDSGERFELMVPSPTPPAAGRRS